MIRLRLRPRRRGDPVTTGVLAVLAAFGLAGCAGEPVPVLHDELNQVRYTRCVLRGDGEKLYSSNYVGQYGGYPPGSPAQVTMFSAVRVDLLVNRIPHQMFPVKGEFNPADVGGFLRKYFVESREQLGLEGSKGAAAPAASAEGAAEGAAEAPGVDDAGGDPPAAEPPGFDLSQAKPTVRSSIRQGIAAVGMSKADVFMALGPPVEINFGTVATNLDLDVILGANRWVYYPNPIWKTFGWFAHVYLFDEDGVLTTVEQ